MSEEIKEESFNEEVAPSKIANDLSAKHDFPLSMVIGFAKSENQCLRGGADELVVGLLSVPKDGEENFSCDWMFIDGDKMTDEIDPGHKFLAWLTLSNQIAQLFPATMPVRKSIETAIEDVVNILDQE